MKILAGIIIMLFLSGCATGGYYTNGAGSLAGVYHEVKSGETLWYISKLYDVDLKRIIRANRLPDASKLEVGQLILVPEVEEEDRLGLSAKEIKLESFAWPVKGTVISYFGSMRNMAKNSGIDIQARKGASVKASRSGKVTFISDHMKGYGKTIILDHFDEFQTVYAHNSENLVKMGQNVKRGTVIAKVGETGRATKPTLHFEIRKKHKPQNPFYYLP